MQLVSYLSFNGNCEEAFKFYEKSLGGKILMMTDHNAAPAEMKIPDAWRTKIMHARMAVGDSLLMGSDAPPDRYQQTHGICIAVQLKDPAEADRIFSELSENGSVQMPIQQTFWALRFGMLQDRFGIPWMINCEQPAQQRSGAAAS
jgi:PhnB protein